MLSMYDQPLTHEILLQIKEALNRVNRRFLAITTADDFLVNDDGVDRLDSICMMLIAMGENLKHIDKITNGTMLSQYPEIDWKGAKGIRDIISHHYFDINAEIIFSVCDERLNALEEAIDKMLTKTKN